MCNWKSSLPWHNARSHYIPVRRHGHWLNLSILIINGKRKSMAIPAALVTGDDDWVSHDILMVVLLCFFVGYIVFIAALPLSWIHSFKSEEAIWVCSDANAFTSAWLGGLARLRFEFLVNLCAWKQNMRYEPHSRGKYHWEELKFL